MTKLLLLLLLPAFAAYSQSIRGIVVDEKGNPIPSATILVLQPGDSSTQKMDVANTKGLFAISNLPTGTYLLSASHIGYSKAYTSAVKIPSMEEIRLVLTEHSSSLKNCNYCCP